MLYFYGDEILHDYLMGFMLHQARQEAMPPPAPRHVLHQNRDNHDGQNPGLENNNLPEYPRDRERRGIMMNNAGRAHVNEVDRAQQAYVRNINNDARAERARARRERHAAGADGDARQ